MDILFPKYDQYIGNLDILILYKDGTFLKLSEDGITIQLDNSLSMFFKKPFNEKEINNLVEGIDNTFSYFFNCLDKNNIENVKNQIVKVYKKDAYYNILTIKEHVHNILIMMQKANVGLNRLNKYYKSYWSSQFNETDLYNIYTNNIEKVDMMLTSYYLNGGIMEISYDDGYKEVSLDDEYYIDVNYQYSSDGGDYYESDYEPVGPTYLTNTQNEAYFINTDLIEEQPSPSPSPSPMQIKSVQYTSIYDDGTALINEQEEIENGEIEGEYEDINKVNNYVDRGCQYVNNELHECFNIESICERDSLELSQEESNIGYKDEQDYFDYLNEEVTEESEKLRQEIEARRLQEKRNKENWYILWWNKIKHIGNVISGHIYETWVYVKDNTINAYNYVSSSLSNWYYGDSRNHNKAKAF